MFIQKQKQIIFREKRKENEQRTKIELCFSECHLFVNICESLSHGILISILVTKTETETNKKCRSIDKVKKKHNKLRNITEEIKLNKQIRLDVNMDKLFYCGFC